MVIEIKYDDDDDDDDVQLLFYLNLLPFYRG